MSKCSYNQSEKKNNALKRLQSESFDFAADLLSLNENRRKTQMQRCQKCKFDFDSREKIFFKLNSRILVFNLSNQSSVFK